MPSAANKCSVLGGAGFLGSHLTEALIDRGHEVRVFDKTGANLENLAPAEGQFEFQGGDLVNEVDLEKAVAGVDTVYHLISTTLPASSNRNPVYDVETNLLGTLRLLQICLVAGVRRLVFVSSGGTVYGEPESLPISESHPTRPIVSYGVVKLAIERYLELFHRLHGLSYTVVRLANPYGPRQDPRGSQGAASVFLGRALRGEPIRIWGDGSVVRDYIFVKDAVSGLLAAAEKGGSDSTYNIGSGEGTSLTRLVEAIGLAGDLEPEVEYLPARNFDVPANVLDVTRARTELGWAPSVSLEEGLRLTWDWLRSRPS
jgi:UDP-glucose 4-epimerase